MGACSALCLETHPSAGSVDPGGSYLLSGSLGSPSI